MLTDLEFAENILFATLTRLSGEFSAEDFVAAAARYQVVVGFISDQPDGVIQDPLVAQLELDETPKAVG